MATADRRPALVLLLCGLLAACGGPASPGREASVLHRGLGSDPDSLDPQRARSTQSGVVLRDIGEGLTSYSPAGELVPGAAESWTVSDDGLTYTFTLRADARWSNGEPVTAAHFAFSLRRLVDPATAAFYAELLGNIVNAKPILAGELPPSRLGVEATDEHTLVIRLERPTPYLLQLLANFTTFPAHPDAVAAHGEQYGRPGMRLSNGAYVLEEWSPNSVLSLRRNPHYWNAEATTIEAVRYHVISLETAQLNRYDAGELCVTDNVPPDAFPRLRRDKPGELRVSGYLGVYFYGFNLTKPPFRDDLRVRQALSMAVDRDFIVATVTGRGELPAYAWVPPGVANFESRQLSYAGMTQAERNAQARRLLQEAGYGPHNPLRIELRYNTSDTEQSIAAAVQAMWRETLGVETTLINEEFKVLLGNIQAADVTQVFRGSWIGDYNDPHTFLSVMESGNPSNMPRYSSAEYDARMRSAGEQPDPLRRQLFYEEAERVLLADHAVIPIYFYVSKHLVCPELRGWQDNVLDYHYSQHLSLAPAEAAP